MFSKIRTYVIGGMLAIAAGVALAYNGVNKTVKDVEEAAEAVVEYIGGPVVGSPEWFEYKKKQHEKLVDQAKNVRYMLQTAFEWNEQTNLRFSLNTLIKTCHEVVDHHNDELKKQLETKPDLDIKEIDPKTCR